MITPGSAGRQKPELASRLASKLASFASAWVSKLWLGVPTRPTGGRPGVGAPQVPSHYRLAAHRGRPRRPPPASRISAAPLTHTALRSRRPTKGSLTVGPRPGLWRLFDHPASATNLLNDTHADPGTTLFSDKQPRPPAQLPSSPALPAHLGGGHGRPGGRPGRHGPPLEPRRGASPQRLRPIWTCNPGLH